MFGLRTGRRLRPLVPAALAALVVANPALAEQRQLVDFALEDQFGTLHRREDVEGTVVLLIGSDKGGSEFNGAWSREISESLGEHPAYPEISHLAHADLRGVPFFVKGMVRSKFPEDPDRWVLLDWKGILSEAYDFQAKSSNILIFSRRGDLLLHAAGREPDEPTIESVVSTLRRALDEP